MKYILHYDAAALIISVAVMVNFYYKKTIYTRLTQVFSALLIVSFVSNVLDIVTAFMISYPSGIPAWVMYLLNMVYLILFNGVSAIYFLYIMVTTGKSDVFKKWEAALITIPILTDIALIVTTPATGLIFRIDENNQYMHGDLFLFLYISAFFYVGVSLIRSFCCRKRMTRSQISSVYFYTVSSLISVALQMAISNLMITQFFIAIATLLIYLSMENPMSYEDTNIGCYNYKAFGVVMKNYIESKRKCNVIGVYMEGLRYVIEPLGRENEALLLKEAARILEKTLPDGKVFYLSGYRFAFVGETGETDWEQTADTVYKRFQSPIIFNDMEVLLGAKVCLMSYPETFSNAEEGGELLEYCLERGHAEQEAKIIRGNQELLRESRRENMLLQIMKKALRENEYDVYYQPIYSQEEKRYVSAEALVRLYHRELGFISPEEFIPLAEKNGMILEIGEQVFRKVCRFIKETQMWRLGIEYIDVNLSAVQCMQESLSQKVIQIMDEYHVDYHRINLEITETAAVASQATLEKNMKVLMQKGIRFSLDDYGTGFANTAAVIKYPFHTVKIDKSMLWAAQDSENAMYALQYTISMLHAMRKKIVVEGVETKEQVKLLEDMKCDFFQGYHFSKPIDKEAFWKLIRANREQNGG